MSKSKNSQSQNSSDKEIDFLEEEFLKCDPNDLPVPKKEIEIYNYQVLEVMKSGCNRQIAEYVMLEYKKLEDAEQKEKDNKKETLEKLRKNYFDKLDNIIKDKKNSADKENIPKDDSNEYEEEINEFWDSNKEMDKNEIKNILHKVLKEKANDEETKQLVYDMEIYRRKRDAVIEAALRKVKKIVNDKEEYKKFFKGYYGKVYVEDEDEDKDKDKEKK